MEPKYSNRTQDGSININYNRYKREINGLRKAFWQVVYELQSYKEVEKMDTDTFLEAYAALVVLKTDDN